MLTELRIANLGVIAETVFEPGPGLTVVTGETGAGKTMVVTGLGLIAGARGDARIVRHGSARASVEARFVDVSDDVLRRVEQSAGELEDGELLVVRHVASAGRSRSLIGGVQVPGTAAAEIGGELVTVHGQSEQLRLGSADRQRDVLDAAAGAELAAVLQTYRAAYAERRAAAAELEALTTDAQARAREADLLAYGLKEIAAVGPLPGEDADLAAEAHRLQAVDDLRLASREATVALSGDDDAYDAPSTIGLLAAARKALEAAAGNDPRAAPLADQAREAAALIADLAAETSSYLADLDADPLRLEAIAERRSALQALTRKYGTTVDEVLAWSAEAARRLTALQGGDERGAELSARVSALTEELTWLGGTITRLRRHAADLLAGHVRAELAALAMPRARLLFTVSPLLGLGPHGADQVALLFAANRGGEPGPLAKVASGGELSRVRLALEVVLAGAEAGHTFVFDEVDAGVGGAVALEVGARLARLAESSQVIVVTHLAQVAAFADTHVVVSKEDDGEVTTAGLVEVTGEARRRELARMMGGLEGTESSLAHARELLRTGERKSHPPSWAGRSSNSRRVI